ncbi:MAG: VPLPA-CTERM sorting domain-containing protein [Pseudomonadota bacterium]
MQIQNLRITASDVAGDVGDDPVDLDVKAIPLPASFSLLALALAGFGVMRRRAPSAT